MLTERYRERLSGVLSCCDRIIVTGTLPWACYAQGMTAFRVMAFLLTPHFSEADCEVGHARRSNPERSRFVGLRLLPQPFDSVKTAPNAIYALSSQKVSSRTTS